MSRLLTPVGQGGLTRRSLLKAVPAAAAVALPLTWASGCSVLDGSQSDGGDSGDGKLEKTSLRVGALPIIDTAPLHLAQANGYFKTEGLTVELVTARGSAETLPQLVSGNLDFTFVDWTSLFQAQAKGVSQFVIVNAGYQADARSFLVMTKPDSGIRKPQDLPGKTIAINVFANISELSTRSALQVAGVSDTDVKFVTMPFPEMAAALQAGRVDAAFMVEPFITQVQRDLGAIYVLDTATGPTEGIAIAGYAATQKFAQEHPGTVAAFRRAMDRAQSESTDRAKIEETVKTYVKIDDQIAKLMSLGTWPTTINRTRLQRVSDLMSEFKVLGKPLDVGTMLPQT